VRDLVHPGDPTVTGVGTAVDRRAESPPRPAGEPRSPSSWRAAGLALVVYLVVSIVLWWGVWSTHPSTTTTCGCGDAARFIWFFKWPAYALTHGHDPFYSSLLFHPTGINLLNDTSVLALGVILAPVTWVAGPVAAMNVALTLAPVLSAWAMFVLLRRWVEWAPSAFIGGLAYGFSPFLITELALNQLNIAFVVIPPLVVMALDELLVRQRRSPYPTGVALAALLVVQFFVGTEVLVITCLFAVVAVVLMVVFVGLRQPGEILPRTGHALRGSATAVGVAAVVLAYPVWFLLRGPAHLTGPIWSNGTLVQFGTTFTSFWRTGGLEQIQSVSLRFGGYQGPTLPVLGYLGPGLIVVAVAGVLVWRHDRRLLLFGALGVVAAVLSLGPGHGYSVPWQLVDKLPWVGDVVEVRFTVVLILCSSILVGVTIDRFRTWLRSRPATLPLSPGWMAAALAVVMLVPTAIALWPNVPLTTRAVELPTWYAEVGSTLPPGRVLLSYPVPFSGLQSSQAWQAINGMRYAQAGGGGPEGQAGRAGDARPGFEVLFAASFAVGRPPGPTPSNLAAIRRALTIWGVTTIVVPDQEQLPIYERGRSSAYAVALFTAAMGRRPRYSHSAWVWSAGAVPGAPVVMSRGAFAHCVDGAPASGSTPQAVPTCVLTSAR
jgi:hypothetical protein